MKPERNPRLRNQTPADDSVVWVEAMVRRADRLPKVSPELRRAALAIGDRSRQFHLARQRMQLGLMVVAVLVVCAIVPVTLWQSVRSSSLHSWSEGSAVSARQRDGANAAGKNSSTTQRQKQRVLANVGAWPNATDE